MVNFLTDRVDAVLFVDVMFLDFQSDCPLITITRLGTSEVCCVNIATDILSEDTVKTAVRNYFGPLMNTW